MDTTTPTAPYLERRSVDYWHTSDISALAEVLRHRADCHEWLTAAGDRKNGKELCRFYHKPANYRGKIPASGIVLEHNGTVRTDIGDDRTRARAVLESLEQRAGQLALFGLEVAL